MPRRASDKPKPREASSARIARIAAKGVKFPGRLTLAEIKALAASALTQREKLRGVVAWIFATLILVAAIATPPAAAHGDFDWINKGKYRSASGELCCGIDDCYVVPPDRVEQTREGYRLLDHDMTVPAKEAMQSEDGKYWICKVGARRRCFFAPLTGL